MNDNEICPMCQECIEHTSKRCPNPKTRLDLEKENKVGKRPCRKYAPDYRLFGVSNTPTAPPKTKVIETKKVPVDKPIITKTPKSAPKERRGRETSAIRCIAEQMFRESKTKTEVREVLISEFKKLGRDDIKALQNANSMIWNVLNKGV